MYSSKRKTVFSIVAAFVLIMLYFSISSCSRKPELRKISDIQIIGIKNNQLLLSLVCTIYNPAPMPVVLTDSDFDILYEDNKLASFSFDRKVKFPATGSQDINVEADLNLSQLQKNQEKIFSRDTQLLAIEGNMHYDIIGIPLGTSINQTFEFNYYEEMQSYLNDLYGPSDSSDKKQNFLSSFRLGDESSFTKIHLLTDLAIVNDQGVDINVHKILMEFRLDEKKPAIATWQLNESMEFDSFDTLNLPVDLEVNTFRLATGSGSLFGLGTDEALKVYIKGELELEISKFKYIIPLSFSKEIDPSILKEFL